MFPVFPPPHCLLILLSLGLVLLGLVLAGALFGCESKGRHF